MRKVIFIGSTAFSGSTMLDLMLSNSEKGFSCGEIYALFRPWRTHHLEPDCINDGADCQIWSNVRNCEEVHLYEHIFNRISGIEYIVDSSKDPVWINNQRIYLEKAGIHSDLILLWKDPLSYAYSLWKRGSHKQWKKKWTNYYRRMIPKKSDWISIRYSDLIQDPSSQLRMLCKRLDIEYREGMEKFWEGNHHTLFGSDSVRPHFHEIGSREFERLNIRLHKNKTNSSPDSDKLIKRHRKIYLDNSYLTKLPSGFYQGAVGNHSLIILKNFLIAHSKNSIIREYYPDVAMSEYRRLYLNVRDEFLMFIRQSSLKHGKEFPI